MGRRQRSSRDEEEDDNLEKEWEKKRQRTIVDEDIDTNGQQDKCAKQEEDAKVIKSSSSKEESPDDKIERMKLKKSRQKERRKEKKANAAAAVESRKNATRKVHKEKIENKKKENKLQQWTTLRKGVQRLDVVVGKGPFVQDRKKCRVSYVLRAKKHISGKILDSSTNFGFRPGKGEVIQGWDIGIEGMRVGGIRRLNVPKEAGYGDKDIGAGRGADLFFQLELIHVAP